MIFQNELIVKNAMEKLDFVQWDRMTEHAVYGWIDREQDGYKDFVVMYIDSIMWSMQDIAYVTSSEKYSLEIGKRLGHDVSRHSHCSRVEDNFDIKNCIKL